MATRFEEFLDKIAGETVEITPENRFEKFLDKIAGETVEIEAENTFEEKLEAIATAKAAATTTTPSGDADATI